MISVLAIGCCVGETDHIWPWAHLLCSSRFWFLFSFPIWADDYGHPFHPKTSLCPTTYICATLQVMSSLLVGSRDCFEHVSLIFTLFASRVYFVTLCFGELMFSLMWCRVCLLSLCVLVNSVSHLWGDYFVVHIYILQMFTFTHMHGDRQWWSNRILHTSFYEWLNHLTISRVCLGHFVFLWTHVFTCEVTTLLSTYVHLYTRVLMTDGSDLTLNVHFLTHVPLWLT